MEEAGNHEGLEAADKRKKIMKPVTFPNKERRERYTKYCKARKTNFSALVRKLLEREMRENPISPPGLPVIRVIKEPGK